MADDTSAAPCTYTPGTAHIDITAPGGIDALLAFHRRTFGSAVMHAGDGEDGDGEGGQDGGGDGGDQGGDDDGGDGGDQGGDDDGGDCDDLGFPPDTPVRDMTLEQQVAYYRHQSRVNERRWKATGVDAKEIVRLQDAADELERIKAQAGDDVDLDQVREDARREGENLGAEKFQRVAVRYAVRAAAAAAGVYDPGDEESRTAIDALTDVLDASQLLADDGEVDEAKVQSILDAFAQRAPDRGPRDPYSMNHRRLRQGDSRAGSVAAAQAKYAEKYTTNHQED
ncbi:hypothetical protein [Puerhibacterium puerhi]|uniref:hypothetical protein n=1 Tax=Puerhibacterium puerhi TaxID=2692623 RepID=UPI00135C3944|nr:hypothetical protein [Puerhibacterium puerhi]